MEHLTQGESPDGNGVPLELIGRAAQCQQQVRVLADFLEDVLKEFDELQHQACLAAGPGDDPGYDRRLPAALDASGVNGIVRLLHDITLRIEDVADCAL